MKQISLSKRSKKYAGLYFAETSDDLFDLLNQYNWHVLVRGTNRKVYYAKGYVNGKHVLMHRWIWEHLRGPISKGDDVDHIDKNGLNNDPANLRTGSHSSNCLNCGPLQTKRKQSSNYRGVSASRNRWIARLQGKPVGRYNTEEEAARARDRAAFALNPEFAWLNFPDELRPSSP